MKEQYGEYEIIYNENNSRFEITIGESDIYADTLLFMKHKLDKLMESEKKFKRIPCFFKPGWQRYSTDDFIRGSVTSYIGYDGRNHEIWTVSDKKLRKKRYIKDAYADTDNNQKAIDRIRDLRAQESEIRVAIETWKKGMEKVTIPGVKTDFE